MRAWKLFFLLLSWAASTVALTPATDISPASTTREHLKQAVWWPTRQIADQSQFAGSSACADCHDDIVRTQIGTQMARTLMPAARSTLLAAHTGTIFKFGSWRYEIEREKSSFTLRVTDGAHERSEPLEWAFGSGEIAQSYLWRIKDQLIESRFNYFAALHGFDRTPGRLRGAPITLDMAQGRKIAEFEARSCYACHTTALTTAEPLSAARFKPGITCEACHGPGRAHVDAMSGISSDDDLHIVNPATLTPAAAVDFCGACHATPRDVELMGVVGPVTVRFPAYRLEKSRCWGQAGDARLTCFACHNPHQPLQRDAAAYDSACLRCHANAPAGSTPSSADQAGCPVAQSRCTSCHMPKINVQEMHYRFTDHDIRVVKADSTFPD